MDLDGLQDLWVIGRSPKRRDEEYKKRVHRTQIGKFGIGKLAASALAHTITYVSRVGDYVRAITVDFRDFDEQEEDFELPVSSAQIGTPDFDSIIQTASEYSVPASDWYSAQDRWTACILTNLKPTAAGMSVGKLRWVLSTAMPITEDFALHLGSENIKSSKDVTPWFTYSTSDFDQDRIERLNAAAGETFTFSDGKLISDTFPSGLSFDAAVFGSTLNAGKSGDLGRSYGFFVRVRNRLVNERDALFGMTPRAFRTWNRFRATINADDLDDQLTAPREGVGDSKKREVVQALAREIFNACRSKHDQLIAEWIAKERKQKELGRNPVSNRLVEVPVADVLQQFGGDGAGADADDGWFYLGVPGGEIGEFVKKLYEPRTGLYSYRIEDLGPNGRLVQYRPDELTFILNESHELVKEYADDYQSRRLLEDFVTAEAMLEVYMREAGIDLSTIGEILQARDTLIRALAKNQSYSLKNIAHELREASGDKDDLEVALVAAMRSFGFIAKHVAGAGRPDGVARFYIRPGEEKKYTLEAKSTLKPAPSLSAIDFAGLTEHMEKELAQGCILIAPGYPGAEETSAAEWRAKFGKISCWTISDLSRVVDAAEDRHISAAQIADIIEGHFSPTDVKAAVEALLSEPNGNREDIERALLDSIEQTSSMLIGAPMDVAFLHGRLLGAQPQLTRDIVREALKNIARKSNGLMRMREDEVVLLSAASEIRRRVTGSSEPDKTNRRTGDFKGPGVSEF
ncbi:hypothetical protein GCM10007859_27420 [Brevundimonas denitrificans]|uniref:Restriction endonuclease n=2 Tax=Brevundimonas denitrificans TaxID=1443434 RepID=A0ABQ6BQD8_9CAUL|nr:hypothetical protein GCM10007859_27420 [Brevundimonas denitrificans]